MRNDLDLIIQDKQVIKEMFFTQPQAGKSLQNTVHFLAYFLIKNPTKRIILVSSTQDIVVRFSQQIRRIVRSQLPVPEGVRAMNNLDYWQTGYGRAGEEGGLRAVGVGGALASFPADLIAVDDAVKNTSEAKSPSYRNKMWDFWAEVNQRSHNGTSYLFTMTRRHQDDLAGRILDHEKGQWRVTKIPALSLGEDEDVLGRPKNGVIWASRFSYELLCKKRESNPELFNAVYQQEPSFTEGGKFKYDDFKWYEEKDLPRLEYCVISLDGAWKKENKDENGTASFSTYTVWGVRGENTYLIDVWKKKEELPEVKQAGINLYAKYINDQRYGYLMGMLVEDAASGKAIIQELGRKSAFNIIPVTPLGSKLNRAEAVLHLPRNGHVFLPSDKDFIHDYVEEMISFPTGKKNDQVDSTTQAWQYLITELNFTDNYAALCE